MNLLQFLDAVARIETSMTKGEFGEMMHDPLTSEDEKDEILKRVQELGGYDNLED